MCHLILFLPVIGLPVFWLWPLSVALPVYLVILLLSAWVYYYVIAAMRRKVVAGPEALIGSQGKVVEQSETGVWVRVRGELWSASSAEALKPGDAVEVVDMEELTLSVRRPRRAEIRRASARERGDDYATREDVRKDAAASAPRTPAGISRQPGGAERNAQDAG